MIKLILLLILLFSFGCNESNLHCDQNNICHTNSDWTKIYNCENLYSNQTKCKKEANKSPYVDELPYFISCLRKICEQ